MLQVNKIHESPTGYDVPASGQQRNVHPFWKDMRSQLHRRVTTYVLPIFPEAIEASKQCPKYAVPALQTHRERPNEVDPIEHRMNHINEHIRYDMKNKFLLRTPMMQRDTNILLAGFKGMAAGQYSAGMWYLKLLREPVYDVIRVLAQQDFYIDVANKLAEGKKDMAVELFRGFFAAMGYNLEGV